VVSSTTAPRRNLSSVATIAFKIGFPVVWIGSFAVAAAVLFVVSFDPPADPATDSLLPWLPWCLLAMTVFGAAVFYRYALKLRWVAVEGDSLVVSDVHRRAVVPLAAVARVSHALSRPPLLWIDFRQPTVFGTRIIFMPRTRLRLGFGPHPLIAELTTLAAQASGAPPLRASASERR
jgi:hypothetical protein